MTTGRSREFRLLNYYLGNEWAKDLSERNSIVYFELLAEVSLFVSVLVKAAREAHASTGNVPQWLREGQLVLDHLQFEKVSLGAGSVTIEARRDYPPAEKPEFTQWIWSRQLRSVSLVSGQYKCNPTTNERVIWLPYLNLNQVPSAVLSRMAPWLEVDATGAVLLECLLVRLSFRSIDLDQLQHAQRAEFVHPACARAHSALSSEEGLAKRSTGRRCASTTAASAHEEADKTPR